MRAGLRVPPAFVIPSTAAEQVAAGRHKQELADAIDTIVAGRTRARLAVRASAEVSIPGAFDTVLDVVPEDVGAAVAAVIKSAKGLRAMTIARELGHRSVPSSAVVVQRQVDAAVDESSGSGVAESRDPAMGMVGLAGPFVWGARGDALSSGVVPVHAMDALGDRCPAVLEELTADIEALEQEFGHALQLEFAVESATLWYLQFRTDCSIARPPADGLSVLACGRAVSSGIGRGKVHVDLDDALDAIEIGESVVIVLETSSPASVAAMTRSAAVLTVLGGPESHAAVVSRASGVPAVLSVQGLVIGEDHIILGDQRVDVGDTVVVDGANGWIGR